MKVNYLLNDILKGIWLLDYNQYQEYKMLASKFISGGMDLNKMLSPSDSIKLYDHNGAEMASSSSSSKKETVGVVNMVGVMVKHSGLCITGTDYVVQQLQESDDHPDTIGTILRMDGPGSSVSAVPPLLEFAANKKKPVVALCDSALSGYYWTAVGVCDYIIAENTLSSRFGSVGVVLSFSDSSEKRKKEGITDHNVYADESEHKNLTVRLALEGKYDEIKKEMLSPVAIQFQDAVRVGRPNLKEELGVLTGKTFGANEARELGMIDSIGNFQQAVKMVFALSELNQYKT